MLCLVQCIVLSSALPWPRGCRCWPGADGPPGDNKRVENSHYSLVIAAAQAAGPCPPGEEAAWGRRVHGLTVDLHLIAQQARQDIERLESARTFIAFLEKVEIEESSRRGLLTLRLPSGESEPIRTEQKDTDRGQALIERARSLEGRWVLVYRDNERKTGQRNQSVRMLAHLMDLGADGTVPNTTAKKMLLEETGGDVARAQQVWTAAGLPSAARSASISLSRPAPWRGTPDSASARFAASAMNPVTSPGSSAMPAGRRSRHRVPLVYQLIYTDKYISAS